MNLDTVAQPATCRFCSNPLQHTFANLGLSPLCESVRTPQQLDSYEVFYPLHVLVCERCWLVQLREYVRPSDIFSEYAYFSSNSDSWLAHARNYVDAMVTRFSLGPQSQVIEIASNDGYLLQYVVQHGIPALGIEPAANVAAVAAHKGIETLVRFFDRELAGDLVADGREADLLLGNNVLAHVPDINDFVAGLRILLAPSGVLTMEFPHLLRLMQENQFDTIYHEHYSYLSLLAVSRIFAQHGLRVFDVQRLATHGGSLRIFACHASGSGHADTGSVDEILREEQAAGLASLAAYQAFQERIQSTKLQIMKFFLDAKLAGRQVAGYGAPGKGVTLLHYCGIDSDLLSYTVDRNQYKQGNYLPGTQIAIHAPQRIFETRPEYVFVLPWNLRQEITQQMAGIRQWGGQFVVPIPKIELC